MDRKGKQEEPTERRDVTVDQKENTKRIDRER